MTIEEMRLEATRINAEAQENSRKGALDFRCSCASGRFRVQVVYVDRAYNGRKRHDRYAYYVDGKRVSQATFEQEMSK